MTNKKDLRFRKKTTNSKTIILTIFSDTYHSPIIRSDFNEIMILSIRNQLKENVQNYKFNIRTQRDRIATDEYFIRRFVTKINQLKLKPDLSLNGIKRIREALIDCNIKVCFVH